MKLLKIIAIKVTHIFQDKKSNIYKLLYKLNTVLAKNVLKSGAEEKDKNSNGKRMYTIGYERMLKGQLCIRVYFHIHKKKNRNGGGEQCFEQKPKKSYEATLTLINTFEFTSLNKCQWGQRQKLELR